MASPVRLLVGLGNPGKRYDQSRHNAGSRLVCEAAREAGATLRDNAKFDGRIGSARIGSREIYLFIPATYMNVSGLPVARVARFYKIPVEEILVAHDELELPPGEVRFKAGGGHAGHNGLRDLIKHLGGSEFSRLRIGIGHPGTGKGVADYVLKKPSATEADQIEQSMDAALKDLPDAVAGASGL